MVTVGIPTQRALMGYRKFSIPEYRELCIESSGAAQEEAPDQEIRR
jgi:hypothetical protein